MNTPTEPEGGKKLTTILVLNNAGKPWDCTVQHNGEKIQTNKGVVKLYINGGQLYIHGNPVTVNKGVENILRHNIQTGRMEPQETTATKKK